VSLLLLPDAPQCGSGSTLSSPFSSFFLLYSPKIFPGNAYSSLKKRPQIILKSRSETWRILFSLPRNAKPYLVTTIGRQTNHGRISTKHWEERCWNQSRWPECAIRGMISIVWSAVCSRDYGVRQGLSKFDKLDYSTCYFRTSSETKWMECHMEMLRTQCSLLASSVPGKCEDDKSLDVDSSLSRESAYPRKSRCLVTFWDLHFSRCFFQCTR